MPLPLSPLLCTMQRNRGSSGHPGQNRLQNDPPDPLACMNRRPPAAVKEGATVMALTPCFAVGGVRRFIQANEAGGSLWRRLWPGTMLDTCCLHIAYMLPTVPPAAAATDFPQVTFLLIMSRRFPTNGSITFLFFDAA